MMFLRLPVFSKLGGFETFLADPHRDEGCDNARYNEQYESGCDCVDEMGMVGNKPGCSKLDDDSLRHDSDQQIRYAEYERECAAHAGHDPGRIVFPKIRVCRPEPYSEPVER